MNEQAWELPYEITYHDISTEGSEELIVLRQALNDLYKGSQDSPVLKPADLGLDKFKFRPIYRLGNKDKKEIKDFIYEVTSKLNLGDTLLMK